MKTFLISILILSTLVLLGQDNTAFAFSHLNYGRWHTDAITGANTSNNPNPGQKISFIINPTGMPDITEDGIVNQTDIDTFKVIVERSLVDIRRFMLLKITGILQIHRWTDTYTMITKTQLCHQ